MAKSFTINLSDFQVMLGKLSSFKPDYSPAMPRIRDFLREETLDRFNRQVDPDGVPWNDLSEDTIEKKTKEGAPYPTRILYESGDLYQSFVDSRVNYLGKESLEWGTDVEYAWSHQIGYQIQAGKKVVQVPPRPMVGINDADIRGVENLVSVEVERQILKIFS